MNITSGTIDPHKVYDTDEIAFLLKTDRRTVYKYIDNTELKARKLGKGYKVLGENLLQFMGSDTFATTYSKTEN